MFTIVMLAQLHQCHIFTIVMFVETHQCHMFTIVMFVWPHQCHVYHCDVLTTTWMPCLPLWCLYNHINATCLPLICLYHHTNATFTIVMFLQPHQCHVYHCDVCTTTPMSNVYHCDVWITTPMPNVYHWYVCTTTSMPHVYHCDVCTTASMAKHACVKDLELHFRNISYIHYFISFWICTNQLKLLTSWQKIICCLQVVINIILEMQFSLYIEVYINRETGLDMDHVGRTIIAQGRLSNFYTSQGAFRCVKVPYHSITKKCLKNIRSLKFTNIHIENF